MVRKVKETICGEGEEEVGFKLKLAGRSSVHVGELDG